MKRFNERIALLVVDHVGTMGCAWAFAVLATVALPQALGETFAAGFHPLPLITWLSQSFLQLVLLSIILVGQDLKARVVKDHVTELHEDLHEKIAEHHAALHEKLDQHIIGGLTNRGSS